MKKSLRRFDLDKIENPDFLKDLTYPELDVLSDDIAKFLLDLTSHKGGHLSSNLGVVDATIALCRVFDFKKDKIIFDVGHQCYTYKLLTGRKFDHFREKGGISGFQKMGESPYDHFEAGHSSTSISAAVGYTIARDLKKEKYEVISFIGDSSIANGLALEGLNSGAENGHKMIIVLNDNDMSISKPVGALSRMFRNFSLSSFYRVSKKIYRKIFSWNAFGRWIIDKSIMIKNWFKRHLIKLTAFDQMGYKVIGPIDGHNIRNLERAFNKAKQAEKSTVVIIKTIKGKGYPYAEKDQIGLWHGVGQFNVDSGAMKENSQKSWSQVFAENLEARMKLDENVVTIVPATGLGSGLNPLFQEFPKRMIDVGIAEEHAFTMSSALCLSGYHPVISIYSTFLQRAYDELSHDLARLNGSATILIDRAGFVGKDGETHQGIYDEQFMIGIPNVTVTMPSSIEEAEELFKESFTHQVFAIRYPKEIAGSDQDYFSSSYGKWKTILSGKDTAVISVGPITQSLKKKIQEKGLTVTLVNALYQKPMDETYLKTLLSYSKIIIYDAYAVKEGFPSLCAARLLELGYQGQIRIMAIPDEFIAQASVDEQRKDYHLDEESVLEEIHN